IPPISPVASACAKVRWNNVQSVSAANTPSNVLGRLGQVKRASDGAGAGLALRGPPGAFSSAISRPAASGRGGLDATRPRSASRSLRGNWVIPVTTSTPSSDAVTIQPQPRRALDGCRLPARAGIGGGASARVVAAKSTSGAGALSEAGAMGLTEIGKGSGDGTVAPARRSRNAATDCGRSSSISARPASIAAAISAPSALLAALALGTNGSGVPRTLAIRRSGDFTGGAPLTARYRVAASP